MTKNNKKNKKSFSLYSFLGKIGDVLFIPIIIISLVSSISMLAQRQKNVPTSFLGISLVNILSGSMTSQGFYKGDTVFTKKAQISDIALGDVIAFYRYTDPLDSNAKPQSLKVVIKYNYSGGKEIDMSDNNVVVGIDINSVTKVSRPDEKTVKDAQKVKAKIYFHQVIAVYVDDYGNVFYQTKGSENSSTEMVRSDFVVGEYVSTPRFVRDIISFCSSARGMIILVCIPLSILVLFQCFSLIKQIEIMSIEKQLLKGKKRFDDEELAKQFKGSEMETYNKAYLYYLTPHTEREQVFNYMWGDVLESNKISKKDQKEINVMQNANKQLEVSDKAYWETWINGTKGYTKRKLKKYYEEVSVFNVLNASTKRTIVAQSKNNTVTSNKTTLDQTTDKNEQQVVKKKIPAKRIPKVNGSEQNIKEKNLLEQKLLQETSEKRVVPKITKTNEQNMHIKKEQNVIKNNERAKKVPNVPTKIKTQKPAEEQKQEKRTITKVQKEKKIDPLTTKKLTASPTEPKLVDKPMAKKSLKRKSW